MIAREAGDLTSRLPTVAEAACRQEGSHTPTSASASSRTSEEARRATSVDQCTGHSTNG